MGFKISLAGDQGGGKSTVAGLLIKETGAVFYSAGQFSRDCAKEMGMDIADFSLYTEAHPEIDYKIDAGLMKLNDRTEDMIIDSRMAWHFVKDNFRVYLFCDSMECARRIQRANRETEHFDSVEAAAEKVRQRKASESRRYMGLYNVDIKDPRNYDLLVDTTKASPEQVCEKILSSLPLWQEGKLSCNGYVCPTTLLYPDDEPNAELLAEINLKIELNQPIPPVEVYEKEGVYYVTKGAESAVACAMNCLPHVPFVHTTAPFDETQKYVKMEIDTVC